MADPATIAALGAPVVTFAGLMQIAMPGYTLRLCDGAADIKWGGTIFTGKDARFGVLAGIEGIESGFGVEAPQYTLTMHPDNGALPTEISHPSFQGSAVNLWLAVIDQATGSVFATPEPLFFGEVDTTSLELAEGSRVLTIEVISVFEAFFADNEGQRLSDAWHQSIWPGELGLSNISGVTIRDAWGTRGAGRSTSSSGSGGGFQSGFLGRAQ